MEVRRQRQQGKLHQLWGLPHSPQRNQLPYSEASNPPQARQWPQLLARQVHSRQLSHRSLVQQHQPSHQQAAYLEAVHRPDSRVCLGKHPQQLQLRRQQESLPLRKPLSRQVAVCLAGQQSPRNPACSVRQPRRHNLHHQVVCLGQRHLLSLTADFSALKSHYLVNQLLHLLPS